MTRWCLIMSALLACTHAKTLLAPSTTPGPVTDLLSQFYLVSSRAAPLNLTTCSPATPPTCALNDHEASYVVQRTVHRSGHVHLLLNARTVRDEFALQAAAGQLRAASSRQAALDLSASILANTTSALLGRPLSNPEVNLVALAVARNVQRCVKLEEPAVRDMWAGYVYRVAQQANYTAGDPIGQFAISVVLFLARGDKPDSRPSPLAFAQFVRARLAVLVANMCTPVEAQATIPAQVAPLPRRRQVIQLVSIWRNKTVTVKEVAQSELVQGVPRVPVSAVPVEVFTSKTPTTG